MNKPQVCGYARAGVSRVELERRWVCGPLTRNGARVGGRNVTRRLGRWDRRGWVARWVESVQADWCPGGMRTAGSSRQLPRRSGGLCAFSLARLVLGACCAVRGWGRIWGSSPRMGAVLSTLRPTRSRPRTSMRRAMFRMRLFGRVGRAGGRAWRRCSRLASRTRVHAPADGPRGGWWPACVCVRARAGARVPRAARRVPLAACAGRQSCVGGQRDGVADGLPQPPTALRRCSATITRSPPAPICDAVSSPPCAAGGTRVDGGSRPRPSPNGEWGLGGGRRGGEGDELCEVPMFSFLALHPLSPWHSCCARVVLLLLSRCPRVALLLFLGLTYLCALLFSLFLCRLAFLRCGTRATLATCT